MLQAVGQGARLEVPALWALETANALTVLVRRGKPTESDRLAARNWLGRLPVRVDRDAANLAFSELSELAVEFSLSVYDAAYLELARRRHLPLDCKDGPLREAATKAEVEIWRA